MFCPCRTPHSANPVQQGGRKTQAIKTGAGSLSNGFRSTAPGRSAVQPESKWLPRGGGFFEMVDFASTPGGYGIQR